MGSRYTATNRERIRRMASVSVQWALGSWFLLLAHTCAANFPTTEQSVAKYKCTDLPTLGLSGYCVYDNSLCVDRTGDLVVIDSSRERGTPLVSQTLQGTSQVSGLFCGVQTGRQGKSDGLPFRAYLNGRQALTVRSYHFFCKINGSQMFTILIVLLLLS